MLIVFAFLLFIAAKAGFMGLPMAFIVTSWFFKYAYILFDHTVRGFDEPPTLDIQMVNPFNEQRPLAQVVILGLIYVAVDFATLRMGRWRPPSIAVASLLLCRPPSRCSGLEEISSRLPTPSPGCAWSGVSGPCTSSFSDHRRLRITYSVMCRWELWLPVEIAIFHVLLSLDVQRSRRRPVRAAARARAGDLGLA